MQLNPAQKKTYAREEGSARSRPGAYSEPLPSAVIGGPQSLSAESRKRVTQLSQPDPLRFIAKLAVSWLIIVITIGFAVQVENIYVTLIAVFIIAGRLNTFALLTHEQTHYLGLKSRYGDLITDLLASYPLLILSVRNYSRVHLAHHKFYFTEKDPDLVRKSGVDWKFPMPRRRLAKLFLRDVLALNLIQTVAGKNKRANVLETKRLGPAHDAWLKPLYFAAWGIVFTLTHSWTIFATYWLLPLVTIFQVFIRIGALSEHVYIRDEPLETSTATIIPAWWESLIFPHLNFFFHVHHHYFPGVPYARLPEVHGIFVKEGLVREEHVFHGITRYLAFLMSRQHRKRSSRRCDFGAAQRTH